jgi:hypothetical protein
MVFFGCILSLDVPGISYAGSPHTGAGITRSEQKLIDAARRGGMASYVTGRAANDDPSKGSNWDAERTIRADVIKRLVTAINLEWPVYSNRIVVLGARITGQLDLSQADLKYELVIAKSFFDQPIVLRDATAHSISLDGSYVTDIGRIFTAFQPSEPVSLFADGLRVNGTLNLSNFRGKGSVRLAQANISGDLYLRGSNIENGGGTAVEASAVAVGGNVYLDDGFRAAGTVDLSQAEIGHELRCSGGTFESRHDDALSACYIRVRGNVALTQDFSATGGVCLVGAEIAGDLDCRGGTFRAREVETAGSALDLEQAQISKTLFISHMVPDGILNLSYAHARVLSDDADSWPANGKLELEGFSYDQIASVSPSDPQSRLTWLARQPSNHFSTLPYQQLAKTFRDAGEEDSAKSILIGMEDARWQYGKLDLWERCWNWTTWLTIGYGYSPGRALIFIIAFVILGTVVFWWGHKIGAITPTDNDELSHCQPFNCFVYSLETFLPLVELGQAKHWRPDSQDSISGRRLRVYLWGHIMLGWFFTSMLVVAITGLVRST